MSRKNTVLFLFLVLVAPLIAQKAGNPESEQVRVLALENAWNQAVKEKNRAALDMLMGAELVYVDYDGKLMGKADYIASIKLTPLHPSRVMNEFMNVNLYGNVAVVNGVYRENGEKNGKPYILRERFTDTWVRRGDSWMCVASESTLISH